MCHDVNLERMKFVAYQYISKELAKEFAEPCEVDVLPLLNNMFALRVTQRVLGREVERVAVEYPADWWQAVRERWLPEWAKKRWPVRMRKHQLVARELYP